MQSSQLSAILSLASAALAAFCNQEAGGGYCQFGPGTRIGTTLPCYNPYVCTENGNPCFLNTDIKAGKHTAKCT
ncbi:unnamed protein product [Zymoseptoria tritici ST99CH_3D7]|uniref:Endo-1,3(4)-beta-glucanase 1 carbohydrate binding domain-containing protein n=1 Tax=Zymoseptoria tritici (strain ST99CH_3D7) TaxID=1276538 RepID=A0A1X7RCG7_ZYMT9|nr:unnamed protein product [Zymoseptoria tritici ST99CH_3D7]